MTQSPVFPTLMPNLEFIEHYIDSLETLPLDVQRYVSQIREYDILYSSKLETVSRYLCLYKKENGGTLKRKYLNKIQKCLIRSQQYADEKLALISQIVELIDGRTQLLSKDVETLSTERREEELRNSTTNAQPSRVKMEKKTIIEKPVREAIYVKPKRARRVRVLDKSADKTDRGNGRSNKLDYDDEDELMEEEEDVIDVRPKKETKKKERESKATREREREKEATTAKDEKEEKREEKRNERKEKQVPCGKVNNKKNTANNKHTNSKIKKKKKKEKEVLSEDIAVDPDEPTYCICNRISYGDMIGCDNQDCKIEWFHFDCVNLSHKPKGKWYCPQCTVERKEKSKK